MKIITERNLALTKEMVKRNVQIRVRRPIKDRIFTIPYLDMELYFVYPLSNEHTILFTKKNLMNLGLKISELLECGEKNFNFRMELMYNLFFGTGLTLKNIKNNSTIEDLIILSNSKMHYGASVIYMKKILESIAKYLGTDLLVFPSSIHEIIVKPYTDSFNDMDIVKEINKSEVPKDEQLSDSVYIFKQDTSKLEFFKL